MAGALGNSVMGLDEPDKPKERRPVVTYCRDQSSQAMYGVYRANGRSTDYVMALGDAGNTILVGPDAGMTLIDPKTKAYSATAVTSEKVFGFAPFQTLPSPKQIYEGLDRMRPTYMRSRVPGKEKEIQIFS